MITLPRPIAAGRARVFSWRDRRLADPRHSERVAATLGIALGVCFFVCFLTGLLSHLIQHPPSWFTYTSRPAGLFRLTQGVHVATGIASVPLLFAKLWSVFPRLFQWPLFKDPLHLLERLSLLPLVGGSIFLLVTGVANIELWYPWVFFFPAGHYAVAWVTMGALVIHIAAKIRITRRSLGRTQRELVEAPVSAAGRRRFLGLAATGSAALVAVTIGQTVSPLKRLGLLAPRHPDIGIQNFPVNRTAIEAGVTKSSQDAAFRLTVMRGGTTLKAFTLDEVTALTPHEAELPIACVEGWSASKRWKGVALRHILIAAGVTDLDSAEVSVESLQRGGMYRKSIVNHIQLADHDTMLATHVDGEVLAPDHGFPLRLIAPARPGVLQTKWVTTLVVR